MDRPEPSTKTNGRSRWAVLAVIAISLFMILLDVTIVNIALPHIMTAFNAGLSSIEWVINVYVLVFAVLLLTLGKLGDLFGRKRLFLIGMGIFTVASLACSLSPNFVFLLTARGIQAIGSAAMLPATLSIINVEFGKSNRGLALGIWGAVAGAANALGPIIGGALVDAYSWQYIFWINIPVGVIAFIAAIFIVRESTDPGAEHHVDVPGVALITAALFCLTFALVEGQKYGWTSLLILSLFAGALVGFIGFVFLELRLKRPLAQLRLFKDRTFSGGNIVAITISFGLLGVIFLVVLFLQIVLGFNALKAGLTILPLPLAIMAVAPFAGRFTDRIGGRWILFTGTFICALGLFLLSNLSASTTELSLILPLVVTGIGMGMVMAPVTTVVMESTPIEKSGMGAGILSTTRQIGAVMGISVLGAILQSQLVTNMKNALAAVSQIPQAITSQIVQGLNSGSIGVGGVSIPSGVPAQLQAQLMSIFKDQFANSLNSAMKVGIIIVLIGTVASLFISSHIRKTKERVETAV